MRQFSCYIEGAFVAGPVALPAESPSSGERFGTIMAGDAGTASAAVEAARRAAPSWAALSPFDRAEHLFEVASVLREERQALAEILTLDQGKPLLAEAYDEVDELVVYFEMAAADARRLEGSLPASVSAGRRVLVRRLPLGVVGVVSPWNWPYTMGAELIAPALAAGNTVVWVPAPSTSACTAELVRLIAEKARLPKGVLNFVAGEGPVVGAAVVAHRFTDGVGFIGSVATGRAVASGAAGKTQLLELGGNGPMVVLADADVELATEAALEAAFLCAGQSCTAGERFLVQREIRADFVESVLEAVRARVVLGDPFEATTTMGPLNNEKTATKFDQHVADAVRRGASCLVGGRRREGFPTRLYAEATVLDGVSPEMEIAREETFGPVVPVVEVSSVEEALELTNASPFGLTAAVFTEDLETGLAFAERTRAGWVNVNGSTNLWESHLPFGGRAGSVSGRGRVGGRAALETFSEPQTVLLPAPRLAR